MFSISFSMYECSKVKNITHILDYQIEIKTFSMQENPLQPSTKLHRNLELYLMLCVTALSYGRGK